MSERLRQAYLKKWRRELRRRVCLLNADRFRKLDLAGKAYQARHPLSDRLRREDVCPMCGRSDMLAVVETPDLMHYAKVVCLRGGCRTVVYEGRYVRWLPFVEV